MTSNHRDLSRPDRHILQTFFDGSAEQAISALLDDSSAKLSRAELDRLARLIESARKSGV